MSVPYCWCLRFLFTTVCSTVCLQSLFSKYIKALHYRLFMRKTNHSPLDSPCLKGIERWTLGSPHKWPIMRRSFPRHGVIMCSRPTFTTLYMMTTSLPGTQLAGKRDDIRRSNSVFHDDVIKWKPFPRYWPFVSGNSPVTSEFPAQKPVTRSFDVFFYMRLNKRLSKQSWGWWFDTPSQPLWRHWDALWGLPDAGYWKFGYPVFNRWVIKCPHFDEFFFIGSPGKKDNFRCSLRWKVSSKWLISHGWRQI